MAYLGAPLPGEGAATVSAAVDAKAEQIKTIEDPHTKAQLRADGLAPLCADYLNGKPTDRVKNKKDTGSEGDTDAAASTDAEVKIKWTRARWPRARGRRRRG